MVRRRKGQSTLEYIIVLTAIIGAIIAAATAIIRPKVNDIFNHVGTQAVTAVNHIDFSGQ